MTDSAEQNRVGGFAFLERTLRPFHFVLSIVMTAALDLFDVKVNLEKFAGGAQHAQSLVQNFDADAVAGQGHNVVCFFRHSYDERVTISEARKDRQEAFLIPLPLGEGKGEGGKRSEKKENEGGIVCCAT